MTKYVKQNSYRSLKDSSMSDWYLGDSLDTHLKTGYEIVKIDHKSALAAGLPFEPCNGEHYIVGHLFVCESGTDDKLQKNRAVGQTLIMNNCNDVTIGVYHRAGKIIDGAPSWGEWGKLQQKVDVGQVSSLDDCVDNCIYSGVYVNGSHSETFVLTVINNSSFASVEGKTGSVSQFKYALNIDGTFCYKTRVGVYGDTLSWGEWVDLGAASTVDIQDNSITEQKLSIAVREQIFSKIDKTAIVQTIGSNDSVVMSQKALSERLIINREKQPTANGTPQNGKNQLAVRTIKAVSAKKGDKVVVGVKGSIPEGLEIRYSYDGVNSLEATEATGVSGCRTEGIGYSQDKGAYNYYVITKEETVGALFAAVLYNPALDPSDTNAYVTLQDKNVELYATVVPKEFLTDVDLNYIGSNVTLIQSLNNKDDIVTIDPVNTTIDFGADPVLIIKGTSYILKNVCANWRTLNYKANTVSSAIKIIFNTETKLLRGEIYSKALGSGDVVIGSIRHWATDRVIASFPFDYRIKGDVTNENVGLIQARTGIDFIAHRGIAQNGIPENSLDAYRYAGYCGFKYVETDFCPTKDNVLVLMHDASINRTMMNKSDYSAITDTVNVADKTLQELQDNYVLKSSDVRFRREIPTLAEFFNTCKHSGVFPIAEIKTSGTTQEHVLQAYELGKSILGEGNFGFTSFSNELLDYARSLSEKTPLWYISTQIVGTTNSITGKSRESDATWWYPSYSTLTEENVKAHKMAGIKVAAWTVPVADVDKLIKLNVDSIAGDYLSSDICGLVGKVAKSAGGFSDFSTNGTVANNILTLTSGQTLTATLNAGWIGGYYFSIIAKGNFKVTAKNLSATVVADKPERFIYQGLAFGNTTFKIEAVGDTEVEFVEIGVVEF